MPSSVAWDADPVTHPTPQTNPPERWRWLAAGGLAGPAAFIGAWVTGTILLESYSPLPDAISRLAAVGADTRWLMTAGFVGFTAASIPAAVAIRRAIPGSAWTGVLGTGLVTSVVAALPLDRSEAVDGAHGLAAAIGYALFIYGAAASFKPLRAAGRQELALLSAIVAGVSTTTLLATPFVPEFSGLLQRIGLTSLDVWLVTISILILQGRLEPSDGSASPEARRPTALVDARSGGC